MFTIKKRRAVYVFLRGLKHVEQLKKFGDISYISKKMGYVELYLNDDEVEKTVNKLNQYRFVKTVKISPRPDIDPDLDDVHDDVFFEAYDQAQEEAEKSQADEKTAQPKNQFKAEPTDQDAKKAVADAGQDQASVAEKGGKS